MFGVGFASRTAVLRLSACLFGGLPGCLQQKRIIVRCSVCCWVKNELLFAPDPASQLGLRAPRTIVRPRRPSNNWVSDSDFTIVRYSAQYLEQRVLTTSSTHPVWCFSNYCSLSPSWTLGTTNKKTHANAWALLKFVIFNSYVLKQY